MTMKQQNRTWVRVRRIVSLTAVMLIGACVPNSGSVQEAAPCPDGRAIGIHVITITVATNTMPPPQKKQHVCQGDVVVWNIAPPTPTVEFYLWFVPQPGQQNPMETGGGVSGNGKLVDMVRGNAPLGEYKYRVILETKDEVVDPHIIVD